MTTTNEGALRAAAKRLGISVDEYRRHSALGLRRCCVCKTWKPLEEFGRDAQARSGRAYECSPCISTKNNVLRLDKQETPAQIAAFIAAGGCEALDCKKAGVFVLVDGTRACARHLKSRVKERRASE